MLGLVVATEAVSGSPGGLPSRLRLWGESSSLPCTAMDSAGGVRGPQHGHVSLLAALCWAAGLESVLPGGQTV